MMIEFNTFEEYATFMGSLSESVAQDFAVEPEEALAVLLCVPPEEVEATVMEWEETWGGTRCGWPVITVENNQS